MGFVNKVVPLGEERAEARRMAKVIAGSAPLVIRTLRDFANQTLPKGPAEIFVPERYKLERIAGSDDRKEGAAAFREKRHGQVQGTLRELTWAKCCWSVAARWAAPSSRAGCLTVTKPRRSSSPSRSRRSGLKSPAFASWRLRAR